MEGGGGVLSYEGPMRGLCVKEGFVRAGLYPSTDKPGDSVLHLGKCHSLERLSCIRCIEYKYSTKIVKNSKTVFLKFNSWIIQV